MFAIAIDWVEYHDAIVKSTMKFVVRWKWMKWM